MSEEAAYAMAEAIHDDLEETDPRWERSVWFVHAANGSACIWHNSFIERFRDWFLIFSLTEGFWVYHESDMLAYRQFSLVPVQRIDC